MYTKGTTWAAKNTINMCSIFCTCAFVYLFGLTVRGWLVFTLLPSFDVLFMLTGHFKSFGVQCLVIFAIPSIVIVQFTVFSGQQPFEFFIVSVLFLNLKWEQMDEVIGLWRDHEIPWRVLLGRSAGFLGFKYRV